MPQHFCPTVIQELSRQVLRSLEAELQRIQQLEADAAPATVPGVPIATPVDVDEEIDPGKEAWRIKFRAEHEVADFQGKK